MNIVEENEVLTVRLSKAIASDMLSGQQLMDCIMY